MYKVKRFLAIMQIGPAQKISLIAYKLNGKAYSEKDQGFQLMERKQG